VCSKGIYFDEDDNRLDVSIRLVEWLETLKAFGAEKVKELYTSRSCL